MVKSPKESLIYLDQISYLVYKLGFMQLVSNLYELINPVRIDGHEFFLLEQKNATVN